MTFPAFTKARQSRRIISLLIVLVAVAAVCQAASIRGVVTDPSGAKVTGAQVNLLAEGKVVATAESTADGSYQILTGNDGRFFLVVTAKSFRQLETPVFYAGRLDNLERNVVLEPEWVRESIVVTPTGTPTPQAQTSAATTVIGPAELEDADSLGDLIRLMPGTFVTQDGQMGAQTSLFVRGGNSDANKVMLDGVDATDLGGDFDLGPLATPDAVTSLDADVQKTIQAGARLLTGGKRVERPGNFYAATVLTNIPENSPAYCDELFGPVASIFRAKDAEDAIRIANSSPFGLGASAWTQDETEREQFINGLESGMVFINRMVASDPRIPFGGVKRSGLGRELGVYGIREFTNIKSVWIQ